MSQGKLKSMEHEKNGTFLWEVKGGSAKMYLKGTVHLVPKSLFPLKDEIMSRFEQCNNLVLEVILPKIELNTMKITDDIVYDKEFTYEDGDSLYNHFDKEKVIDLRNYLLKNNLCSPQIGKRFYKLKPQAVKALIINGVYDKVDIDEEHLGIDYYFMLQAKARRKKILELESAEFQDELLNDLLSNNPFIKGYEKYNGEIKEFEVKSSTNIFEDGTVSRFFKLKMLPWMFKVGIKTFGSLYGDEELICKQRKKSIAKGDPLIGDRDEKMCDKLEKLLETKDSYFVAVGAAHLLGEGSIIERLQKKGYEVVRIC